MNWFKAMLGLETDATSNPIAPAEGKAIYTLDSGRPIERGAIAPEDRDNFVTNRVTVAEFNDAGAGGARSAMGLSAVWACMNLLAGTIASLPITLYRSVPGGVDEEEFSHPLYRILAEQPNADQSPLEFFEFMAAAVELQGNAYSEITRRSSGDVVALGVPIAADSVTPRRRRDAIEYVFRDGGRERVLRQEDVLHIRGFGGNPLGGLSTLEFARRTFGLASFIESAATDTFRNGIRPSGAFVSDKQLTAQQMKEAEERVNAKYAGAVNAGRPLFLNAGMKWSQITINPEDAQMLESRNFSVEEICRWFGVPPHLIGHTAGNTNLGSSIEQQTLQFMIFTLRRRLKRFEQALAKQLLTPVDRRNGLKIKFDLRGLLRGDAKSRQEFYASALQNGWMTINEVRELEGLPPVPGGDVPRMQAQNIPITALGEPAPVAPVVGDAEGATLKAIEALGAEVKMLRERPAAPPPVINVRTPEIRAPNVTVSPPNVTVHADITRGKTIKTIERDDRGLITNIREEES